jgi:ABC-type transport system substrate-binding protein
MALKGVKSSGCTRKEFFYVSGASLAAMALAGNPQYSYGGEKPRHGGRKRVAYRYGSAGLEAHKNQGFMDYYSYCHMYGGLTEQGPLPQVEIYPMLASSWDISPDGREYTFHLSSLGGRHR